MKALKLDRSHDREAFKPHIYEINEGNVIISLLKKAPSLEIGSRLKEIRLRLSMSQKELADKIDVSPSFISQVENNQISPSLSSFVHICNALGVSPSELLEGKRIKKSGWLMRKKNGLSAPLLKSDGLEIFSITGNGKLPESAAFNIAVIEPNTEIKKHFMMHKGREFIYLLKGSVSVVIEGEEEKLNVGDSIYLKEEIPSAWKNEIGDRAELLVVYM